MVRLRFANTGEVIPVPLVPADSGYRKVASVDGWGGGRLFIGTWRARSRLRDRVMPHSMAIWGSGTQVASSRVERFGVWVVRSVLKEGFRVEMGESSLNVYRPSYGVLKRTRQIVMRCDEETWVYRAAWPFRTELIRDDGHICARFYHWATYVDPEISAVEMVAVLTVIGQHLTTRVVSPLVVWFTVGGVPRWGGGSHVV